MVLEVSVMSGAGNIFSVVDNRKLNLPIEFFQKKSSEICEKSFPGMKTEGLLVIERDNSGTSDFILKYFNPDGSYGMMCGNGGRCAVLFALEKNIVQKINEPIIFDVWGTKYLAYLKNNRIELRFPPPVIIEKHRTIQALSNYIVGDFIDVGSPHFVIDFNDLKTQKDFFGFPFKELAKTIRYHNEFQPQGVNVNLYLWEGGKIFLRTYEKGVEEETGSCGTGAISTAISLFLKDTTKTEFEIIPPSKETLFVEIFTDSNQNIEEISLSGSVTFLHNTKLEFIAND